LPPLPGSRNGPAATTGTRVIRSSCLALVLAAFAASAAHAQESAQPASGEGVQMTASQLFDYADKARDAGDFETAENAYRALMQDVNPEYRIEARFRLAEMFAKKQGKLREAATLYREILDEKPDASGVRLELASVLAAMGEVDSARRELRAAEASGLPPDVERLVRFYARALSSPKRFGGGLEVALAPSNNINRATGSDTLGTIIGDFIIDKDAQAKSGVGLSVRGQAFYRPPLSDTADLLLRISSSGDLYKDKRFDDIVLQAEAGPQFRFGADRLALSAIVAHRWFGMDSYSSSYGGNGNFQHPLGKRAQLRLDGSVIRTENEFNKLQDSNRYSLSAAVDRAFSQSFGGGVQLSGTREAAADPGYSTAQGGISTYLFRDIGRTTAVLNLSYSHLEADKKLFIYPERRKDDRFAASVSGTFRGLKIGTFAPLLRLSYERNISTIEIYDFSRFGAEIGITAAF
jgi:tetratricopeptide (TPR) repeat protein